MIFFPCQFFAREVYALSQVIEIMTHIIIVSVRFFTSSAVFAWTSSLHGSAEIAARSDSVGAPSSFFYCDPIQSLSSSSCLDKPVNLVGLVVLRVSFQRLKQSSLAEYSAATSSPERKSILPGWPFRGPHISGERRSQLATRSFLGQFITEMHHDSPNIFCACPEICPARNRPGSAK